MALDSRSTQTGMSVPHNTSTTYGNAAQAFLPVSAFFDKLLELIYVRHERFAVTAAAGVEKRTG